MIRLTVAWNSFRARLLVAAALLAVTKLLLGCGGQTLAPVETVQAPILVEQGGVDPR